MGKKQIIKRNYDNEGNLISKECSCCHKVKPVSEFNKHKSRADGLHSECKECRKKYRQENKDKIKQYKKQYQKDNAERIKEYHKQYRKDNADRIKQYQKDNTESLKEYKKQYYKDSAESLKEHFKKYYKNNAESFKEYYKEYNTKKVEEALQQIKTEIESNPDKYNYIKGKEIYGIIYLVYNTESNKYYVGQTTVGFDNRYPLGWLYEHSKKDTVKYDLELYGENSFEYIKLFKVAYSQHELDKIEAYYINYYDSYENGYNETRGNIFTDRGKEK